MICKECGKECLRVYCSGSCRQKAYRYRKSVTLPSVIALDKESILREVIDQFNYYMALKPPAGDPALFTKDEKTQMENYIFDRDLLADAKNAGERVILLLGLHDRFGCVEFPDGSLELRSKA